MTVTSRPDSEATSRQRGRALSGRLFRLAFRAALHLPGPVLDRIAGRGSDAASRPGADPRARFHAWMVRRFGGPPAVTLAEARAPRLLSLSLLEGRPLPMQEMRKLTLPGPGGPLRARFYQPASAPTPSPALIFLHFGGCVLGDLDTCHTACTILAQHGGFRVLSVEYRLAPEHRYPAALEDAVAALHWLRREAASLGIDPSAIGIGGDSAGGYLAAAASLWLAARGEAQPKCQLLIYPVLEMNRLSLPPTPWDDCYPLTRTEIDWFARQYLRSPADVDDPLCSVARASSLAAMPPTILVQAGHDLLFDEGAHLAERLRQDGVPLVHRVYPTLPHAFSAMSGGVPAARAALVETALATGATLRAPGSSSPKSDEDNR